MIYKLIYNMCNIDLTNILNSLQTNFRTRGHVKLVATQSRTNIHINYVNNRILNVWNNLDYETVHSQSLNCLNHVLSKLINSDMYMCVPYFLKYNGTISYQCTYHINAYIILY